MTNDDSRGLLLLLFFGDVFLLMTFGETFLPTSDYLLEEFPVAAGNNTTIGKRGRPQQPSEFTR